MCVCLTRGRGREKLSKEKRLDNDGFDRKSIGGLDDDGSWIKIMRE